MLKVNNAHKIFRVSSNRADDRLALNGLNLHIKEGEFVTIIGGNGSGKSTLMNVISGVYILDDGSVEINGVDVTHISEHKRAKHLGRVFQDPNMGTAGQMNIEENMMLAVRRAKSKGLRWGFDKEYREMFVEKLASLNLGLETRLQEKVGLLSGGQRQAITLLMATLDRPDILLLDEHTAALDPKTAKIVLELTDKIVSEEKITTLMITHNMRDAIKYGNRLIMLNAGKIVYDVSGEEKKNLTVQALLEKFGTDEDFQMDDKLILG